MYHFEHLVSLPLIAFGLNIISFALLVADIVKNKVILCKISIALNLIALIFLIEFFYQIK